jgi:hypothetical protein
MLASRLSRAERYAERAEKAREEANRLYSEGSRMASVIPMGQPILVGHYSEKRDRAYRGRIDGKFRKASETESRAADLEYKANAAANNTAIYADDPEAVREIDAKLEKMKAEREMMKKCNVCVRKGDRAGLLELVHNERAVEKLFEPDFCGRLGFPDFELTNLGANIRRLEKRRAELVTLKATGKTERMAGDVRIVEDPEIARIQLFYPGKPDEATRDNLKANGFRWAPSEGAWQRQLNNSGRWAAERVLGAN